MDASLTGGLPVTVIGVGTVFAALLALIGIISVMTRFLTEQPAPQPEAPPAPAPAPAAGNAAAAEVAPEAEPDLLPVALAAYALHLQIRGRASAAPTDRGSSNQWALAGRMRQLSGLSR